MPSQCRDGWLIAVLLLISHSSVHAQSPRSDAGRKKPAVPSKADSPIIRITHGAEVDGWSVAETAHFRLFHQHSRTLAEAVLRTAERTAAQQRKWFANAGASWDSKCRICLYPSGEAYSQATGAPGTVAGGHTDITIDEGRVLGRTIHLHGDRDALLRGVLPHEVTHAILAGHFGGERVPRWADEGMAILAETQLRIDLHLRYLPRWREDQLLFRMSDLVRMRDYPEPRVIGASTRRASRWSNSSRARRVPNASRTLSATARTTVIPPRCGDTTVGASRNWIAVGSVRLQREASRHHHHRRRRLKKPSPSRPVARRDGEISGTPCRLSVPGSRS